MTCGIYKIVCTATKDVYIGRSVEIENRWKAHLSALKRGVHPNELLQKLFVQHGEDFEFEIVEECENYGQSIRREWFWLDSLKPTINDPISVQRSSRNLLRYQSTQNSDGNVPTSGSDRTRNTHR